MNMMKKKNLDYADEIRGKAWEQCKPLIARGRIGDAYRIMTDACAKAWEIERKEVN